MEKQIYKKGDCAYHLLKLNKNTNLNTTTNSMKIRTTAIIAALVMLTGTPSYAQARRGTVKNRPSTGAQTGINASLRAAWNKGIKDYVFFNYEGYDGEKVVYAMKPVNAQGVGRYVIGVYGGSTREDKYQLLSNGDFYLYVGKERSKCYLNAQPIGFICENMFFQQDYSPSEYNELVNPETQSTETGSDTNVGNKKTDDATNENVKQESSTETGSGTNDSNKNANDTTKENIEQEPYYPGGVGAFLAANIKYPLVAAENGIQGKVLVQFYVETDGSISDIKVVKGVDPSLDKEAKRVVSSMGKWTPAKQNGKEVRREVTVTVTFQLS